MVFLTSGVLTTIQDGGFSGLRSEGLGPSGAMDQTSLRLLNILLNNKEKTEVLEMHYPAPTILFEESALIAIGGGDFSPKINGKEVDPWKIVEVNTGDTLSFGQRKAGSRAYLAVKGGFALQGDLGSKSSSMVHAIGSKKIHKGDRIRLHLLNGSLFNATEKVKVSPHVVCQSLRPHLNENQEIRVVANHSLEGLDQDSIDKIFSKTFIVSHHSNRMGYRLEGDSIKLPKLGEQVSSSVVFGTIQLLPDGQIVILMADHQTTGGYPRLGQVISVDLPVLAQIHIGQHITFREITQEVAESVFLKQEKEIKKFKTSVAMHN